MVSDTTGSHPATPSAPSAPSARPVGRTSRRRAALVLLPTLVTAAAILGSIADGAVAASFTSGMPFTVTVERLRSKGFGMQLGVSPGTGRAAVLTRWSEAEVAGLCQSSTMRLPVVGRMTMVLTARSVHATDLAMDAYHASGRLDLHELVIEPTDGSTGYHSDSATLRDITIQAGTATAGTFSIKGLGLDVRTGHSPCRLPDRARR
ncbi:DUF6230 family protein [Streptomyces sp. NPDC050636]|uniref:DUF6230 family protein n=1 Tax=Streptomyces sp. NPDC050636 TaxID=3154510 RepID=UPI0034172BDC